MTSKIFKSVFFTSMLVLIFSLVIIAGLLFDIFDNQLLSELKSEAKYIEYIYKKQGSDFSDISDMNCRITIIDKNGKVISDTQNDPMTMENHSNRREVQLAIEKGEGHSSRNSNTLMQKNVYYAKLLDDGKILRVSTKQYTAFTIFMSLSYPFAIVIVGAVLICLFIASRISKKIIKPLNKIDLDNPDNNKHTYPEIFPLLSKISAQKATIANQLTDAYQKQREFSLITENMSEGLLVIDAKANILSYNSAAIRLLDADIQKSYENTNVLTINSTDNFKSTVCDVLCEKRIQNVMTQGTRTYNLIANPVSEKGKIIGAVIIIIDITENAERAVLRREFTANVSHELKTPLTSISGFAELMKDGGVDDKDVMDFSKSIFDESQRLISLVCDIIKISELDEKADKFIFEAVDLLDICKEVAKRFESTASKNNVTIEVTGTKEIISGVKRIIEEIISNLCDNAIKYNRSNGKVVINVENQVNGIELSVSDTGIGIPQDHTERVFERFYRVDKGRSKAVGGTGLGLSIVKHGAAFHDAKLNLESTVDVGTRISVIFNKIQ